ncbi:diguanylate cyclase domain-containing protein [Parablastomonas sp. CN1-191]|uniref:GGDEF domain-containing protein n=1 Tax=Parablastomonas sp. CN1-191 TaxID=3400908 RepID=UPI003BF84F16
MDRGIAWIWAALVAVMALWSLPAIAADSPVRCFAAAEPGGATPHWRCDPAAATIGPDRVMVSILVPAGNPQPHELVTRTTRFAAATITVIGRDGSRASRRVTEADMEPAPGSWLMRTALPRLAAPIARVEMEVDQPRHVNMLARAQLAASTDATPGDTEFELAMAAMCGLLCAPLLFNLAFYRVLRERFLLWHTLAVIFMLSQTLLTSGLINRIATVSVYWLNTASVLTFAGGIAAAALFSRDFVEPGRMSPLERRLLFLCVPWAVICSSFYIVAGDSMRALVVPLYYASFLPVPIIFGWTMIAALLRGSRAVRYQLIAWTPLILVALGRVFSVLGASPTPLDLRLEQHASIIIEIVITALGVVDRFMILRFQRDHAVFESRKLGEVADRDPLTGLLNRRALQARFATLYADGFRSMAVIDLDRFKEINDRFGHSVGDTVLSATAQALANDSDTHAFRIGGEEFLLLLRGPDAAARAEHRRNAIPLRIAAEVHGLDRVVTASMGLVEQAGGRLNGDFAALYAHCDRLLYEAKRAGRNRGVTERIQSFVDRRTGDRRAAA